MSARLDGEALLDAFEGDTLTGAEMDHRAHVEVAWRCLRRHGSDEGAQRMVGGLLRLTARIGATAKYHQTLTLAWIRLVDGARRNTVGGDDFAQFLDGNPDLRDAQLPLRFYRKETLFSDAARAAWVEPDLAPLP